MQPYEIFLLVPLEPVDSAFLDQLTIKDSVHHVVRVVFNISHQRLKMFVQFTKLFFFPRQLVDVNSQC